MDSTPNPDPGFDPHFDSGATPGHRFHASALWRALPAGMRRRWWMFRPLDLIARSFPVLKKRRGVLVIRMDGIGDMVLFRGCLDHYAEALGVEKEDITVLGCESWRDVADEIFAGYRVIAINEHAFARRPLYRFRVSMMVRALAPRVVVNDSYLRRAMMADSLALASGATETISSLPYINEPTRSEYLYYLSQATRIVNTGDYPTHETVRHYRFVSALAGREIPPRPPRISWRDTVPERVGAGPYVVLCPGSNEPGRRWPFEQYLDMARRLLVAGYRVVFVGTRDEKNNQDPTAELSNNPGVVNLIGKTSMPEVLDLMNHAAGVLSNDSGPAHVAIALGTPTLVVVGGGHFGCFFPYPEGVKPDNAHFAFERMDCYHCFWRCPKRATKHDVFPCISAVGADQVWAQLERMLPPVAGKTNAGAPAQ
ncbi:MAG: glycosyltransferase family 9 protein [Rhodospirillales bacterium]|nr:glycosyltransferase family 9 protein [Rhodospirillales bacterium]